MTLGSAISIDPEPRKIGPRSVSYLITEMAVVFGGDTLVTTDVSLPAGLVETGDHDRQGWALYQPSHALRRC
ncbi:hypothetical protein WNZ14_04800 [Hoeflea sp. AS60]|uniref:hypothetical protein n=1 Tax=Hoeflea sp. AS60 TaxID=3135780 RepID=UPI003174395F